MLFVSRFWYDGEAIDALRFLIDPFISDRVWCVVSNVAEAITLTGEGSIEFDIFDSEIDDFSRMTLKQFEKSKLVRDFDDQYKVFQVIPVDLFRLLNDTLYLEDLRGSFFVFFMRLRQFGIHWNDCDVDVGAPLLMNDGTFSVRVKSSNWKKNLLKVNVLYGGLG